MSTKRSGSPQDPRKKSGGRKEKPKRRSLTSDKLIDSSKLEKVEYKDLDLCVFWLDDDVSSLAILTFRIHLLCHPADLEAPSHKVSVTPRRQKKAAKTAGKKKRLATKN